MKLRALLSSAAVASLTAWTAVAADGPEARRWLAGDHHVHSQFSVEYVNDEAHPERPPVLTLNPRLYPIEVKAQAGRDHGLSWMVSTDHGGPNHSRFAYERTYPALQASRVAIPEVIQFYGLEFDTPGGDHSSLILPLAPDEREVLYEIERRWAKHDAWPRDRARDEESRMLEALEHMRTLDPAPLVFANHPSRSSPDAGVYPRFSPQELRLWNDTAPNVAMGMEGAPGHQAAAVLPNGEINPEGARGRYFQFPTLGGFDQMTARLGGFWDSLLGEGRRWWITSTSDSHGHWVFGGNDFWPGEYSKTYVHAAFDPADIIDGLRNGRIFVTTGDLISELDVTASAGGASAGIGGELARRPGEAVEVTIRLRDPAGTNSAGRTPEVARVDLIVGQVTGPAADRTVAVNPTTRVARRFTQADWRRDGEYLTMTHVLTGLEGAAYLRVRGTSTDELEPQPDPRGEDPWGDLWFYANPIFLTVR